MALRQDQYDSIMKTYEKNREDNRFLRESRQKEVYASIPEMATIDDELAEFASQRTRLLLSDNPSESIESMKQAIAKITTKRKTLLEQAGYPASYLDPIYTCPDCKDTGYCLAKDLSKTKCHCFLSQEMALLYEQSNIRELISRENFSTLSYDYCQGEDLERLKRAVSKSISFVKNFKEDYHNLLFYGTVGTGKSFLSGCIANELLRQGHSVVYFSSVGLFDLLARYSFDSKAKETLYNFYKDLYNYECVIIDDLGTEVTNSFVTSQLFSCLNERHLRNKPTIISTNLNLEEIRERYSDRIFSRITSNFTLCKLTGPDVRMSIGTQANK